MRLNLRTLLLAALSAPLAYADVQFSSPGAGVTIPAGSLTVTWAESNTAPAISSLSSYTLVLVVGGNDDSTALPLDTLVANGAFSSGNSVTVTIAAGLAGNTVNGFYLKMTSTATAGGTVINYSNRFTMSGMTGVTAATYANAVPASDTDVPARQNSVGTAATGAAAAQGGDLFTIPYNLQTGLIKYAPMQPVPPTKITANAYTPLYPTSAYTIATSYMALPSITLTVTQTQTYSVSSIENTAAAVAQPTADGSDNAGGVDKRDTHPLAAGAEKHKRDFANFLGRWKD